MAKSRTDELRDKEVDVETEAAYAGGGETSSRGEGDYMIPKGEKVDDEAVAERVMNSADDKGGESGFGG